MDSNQKIFSRFLEKRNISYNEIFNSVKFGSKDKSKTIIGYCSKLDGLGNEFSDIDLYILDHEFEKRDYLLSYQNCTGVEVINVKGISLDIEYWTYGEILKIITEFQSLTRGTEVNEDILKLVLRLKFGVVIANSEKMNEINNALKLVDLEAIIVNKFDMEARSNYADALNFFRAQDYIVALDCARNSLKYAIALNNAKHGKLILKPKWFSRVYINNNGYGNNLELKEFLHLLYFSNISEENLELHVEEMLFFIQELLTNHIF